ncbi:MAG: hypothetical protein P9L99_15530 [Candidatus Lernaella stagnicola]|nr:hypothetical protein [Candidatus Lernaella stagnicola]
MKRRFLIFGCFVIVAAMLVPGLALGQDGDDEGDEEDDNPWGEAAVDHTLNAGWEYPTDYIHRPLVYNKRVVELGLSFEYKYTRHFWDDGGNLVAGSFKTKKETLNFYVGGGLADWLSVSINWPFSYRKTRIFDGNQNYRPGRKNTYGVLAEEATVDFLDHSDPWKLWEMDMPSLGDIDVWIAFSLFRRLDPTTSIILETNTKFATGNDNPRRGTEIRGNITSGQTDFYSGFAVKQSAWQFAFELHGGYNYRLPADTKYAPGELDLADQVKVDGEIGFLIPAVPVLPRWLVLGADWTLACEGHYLMRITESTVEDNLGNEFKLMDDGFEASITPKLVLAWASDTDLILSADIPMQGESSYLLFSRSYYLPPFDIEGNDGVGVTYSLGLKKRWQ